MTKTLVIYNLGSGRRRRTRLLPSIKKHFKRAEYRLEFKNFENFLDSKELHKNFDYDLVIVAGGDGTIRKVASFLLTHNLEVPLGILPIGSANVLAQSLFIPRRLKAAMRVIDAMKIHAIDVGLINKKEYFIEAFSIGYLSERIVAAEKKLKRSFGFAAYLVSFLKARKIPQYIIRFTVDGKEYSKRGNSFFIVNTSRLFGFEPKRYYDMQDGKFEVAVATNKTFLGFVQATYYYYFHDQPPKHLSLLEGTNFTIENKTNTHVQIDGDYIELPGSEITVDILQKKLCVIGNRKYASH
jgi:YegS/Rv2252/BmrU family lipid kinase